MLNSRNLLDFTFEINKISEFFEEILRRCTFWLFITNSNSSWLSFSWLPYYFATFTSALYLLVIIL